MISRRESTSAGGVALAQAVAGAGAVSLLSEREVSAEVEARAFWRMRRRLVHTLLRQTLRGAWFRLAIILLLSTVMWLGLYFLAAEGFLYLKTTAWHQKTQEMVQATFNAFFVTLLLMLLFSTVIIMYGSLFRSPDTAFLLTTPARAERIFLHKFQEAIVFSSWGFLLLVSPMLLAYGIAWGAPWYYYVVLPPLLVTFTYIPTSLGAILCLLIVRLAPGGRRQLIILGTAALLVTGSAAWMLLAEPQGDLLTATWFREILSRLKFTEFRLLPNWWLSTGLLEAAHGNTVGRWSESVLFLTLLTANALFFRLLAISAAARLYRPAYSALYGSRNGGNRLRMQWLDGLTLCLTRLLPRQMRLLIVKDLRLFRRDPVQWSQFLIFFALLALYFFNIRRFSYNAEYIRWVNVVSFLNLSVVGLLMATFTTRFIFPMISLEGARFWILGLLPVRRETILWGKFLFAIGGLILPCSGLILLSDVMLGVSTMVLVSHQLTCFILCLGLSGIAVGLGARLPNLREQSPSRIAAGFGGTLNLVVSTIYILAVVLLTALPCHFYLVAPKSQIPGLHREVDLLLDWLRFWLIAGTAGSLLLGILATVVPLRIGFRAFRRLEF